MRHTTGLIAIVSILTFITSLTAQAVTFPELPPHVQKKWDECYAKGGKPVLVTPEKNETEGPSSDKPIIPTVVCEFYEPKLKSLTCDDGTKLRSCSNTKPLYCDNKGKLVEKCSECECPEGEVCVKDSCQTTTTTSTTSTSTTSTTTTSTTSSSTSTLKVTYTTSSTISETTSSTIREQQKTDKITGKVTATRGKKGRLLVFGFAILFAYAIIKTISPSRENL